MPIEYIEYRLCKEFRCLPEDLDRMPEETFRLFCEFLNLEAKAGRLRASQAKFYGQ